jgi:hypothetical protein
LNAVEIEEAISQLADQPFDPENFPYAFLEAFGNKETTIRRLRAGASNKSDRLINAEYWTKQVHRDRLVTGQLGMIAQASGSSLNASENGSSWSTSY